MKIWGLTSLTPIVQSSWLALQRMTFSLTKIINLWSSTSFTEDLHRFVLLMVERSGHHQLRLVVHPMIYRVLYIPGDYLGFLPSTVPMQFKKKNRRWNAATFNWNHWFKHFLHSKSHQRKTKKNHCQHLGGLLQIDDWSKVQRCHHDLSIIVLCAVCNLITNNAHGAPNKKVPESGTLHIMSPNK